MKIGTKVNVDDSAVFDQTEGNSQSTEGVVVSEVFQGDIHKDNKLVKVKLSDGIITTFNLHELEEINEVGKEEKEEKIRQNYFDIQEEVHKHSHMNSISPVDFGINPSY